MLFLLQLAILHYRIGSAVVCRMRIPSLCRKMDGGPCIILDLCSKWGWCADGSAIFAGPEVLKQDEMAAGAALLLMV
ncbi:hypothetical protein Nepgr_011606 [Nepenthes gracilis]|uniref:Secreted protein n=1 Tax=Nepenthes gracilis TaxID=150966 RepID=A0AAD3XMH2_NEPGR|nr:hypothetical protein Nepgr_011606 [Nepenthes gracilis]